MYSVQCTVYSVLVHYYGNTYYQYRWQDLCCWKRVRGLHHTSAGCGGGVGAWTHATIFAEGPCGFRRSNQSMRTLVSFQAKVLTRLEAALLRPVAAAHSKVHTCKNGSALPLSIYLVRLLTTLWCLLLLTTLCIDWSLVEKYIWTA